MSKNKDWLEIRNQTGITEIYINGDIESDANNIGIMEAWGLEDTNVYPLEVKKALDEATSEVHLHINSGGGDVFAGVAISNMLKNHKGKTVAYVDGLAASAASIIAFGCDEIVIPKNAYLMIHRAMCMAFGNVDDFEKTKEILSKIDEGLVNTYTEKAIEGTTQEQILNFMREETWFTGADAANYFNVSVGNEAKILNFVDVSKNFKNVPTQVLNAINATKTQVEKAEELRIENMKKEIEIELEVSND